jgi:hypothetical protein
MSSRPTTTPEERAASPAQPQPLRIPWRTLRRQAQILLVAAATVAVVMLLLSTLASWFQGRRDEARTVDVIIVVAPEIPSESLVDQTFDLFKRGYAPQLAIVGGGSAALQARLVERGVRAEVMALGPAEQSLVAQLQLAARGAQQAGASSALIASAPAELALWLKLTQDSGLRAYGSPTPGMEPNILELLQAGLRYWRYALLLR